MKCESLIPAVQAHQSFPNTHSHVHTHLPTGSHSLSPTPGASGGCEPGSESHSPPPPPHVGVPIISCGPLWGARNAGLPPPIGCCLHADSLSGPCLSSTGPVRGSCLLGVTAQAGDPGLAFVRGRALELGRSPGLEGAGQVGPTLVRGALCTGGSPARCPPRGRRIPGRRG